MSDWTLSSYHSERYAKWGGNPNGIAAQPDRCAENVWSESSRMGGQCSRKRGHGPERAFCRQHDPEAKKERALASRAKYKLSSWQQFGRANALASVGQVAINLIRQCATHDDLECAVSEYEQRQAEMAALKSSLEGGEA